MVKIRLQRQGKKKPIFKNGAKPTDTVKFLIEKAK